MGQRLVATRKWQEQPYLHWGNGPALGPDLIEAPQPLTAPWLAGLHFEEDEELGVLAVPREKKERRLELLAQERRELYNRKDCRGLISLDKLFLPTHMCNFHLVKAGKRAIPRRPVGNPFERRMRHDWMVHDLEKSLAEVESGLTHTSGAVLG